MGLGQRSKVAEVRTQKQTEAQKVKLTDPYGRISRATVVAPVSLPTANDHMRSRDEAQEQTNSSRQRGDVRNRRIANKGAQCATGGGKSEEKAAYCTAQ